MGIRQLTSLDTLSLGDQIPIGSANNGDDRRAAMSLLLSFMQANLTFSDAIGFETQYSAPSAAGFTVAITDDSDSTHLILTPVAGYAAGTITLPALGKLVDKQEVLVNCTQAVTTLTIGANGATAVTGAPTTLAANDFFKLKYDAQTSTWYRVS